MGFTILIFVLCTFFVALGIEPGVSLMLASLYLESCPNPYFCTFFSFFNNKKFTGQLWWLIPVLLQLLRKCRSEGSSSKPSWAKSYGDHHLNKISWVWWYGTRGPSYEGGYR
jgi:hypothetical protein